MIDLRLGDCLEVMAQMDANSADAIVTDPPYGLEFMGKEWDRLEMRGTAPVLHGGLGRYKPGVKRPGYAAVDPTAMQSWHYAWAFAALRVAKPGAHLLAFGGTRTWHRLACALEDAGWEIRDTIMWVYGSGFPKSLDVSKAIDKAAGAEREMVGPYQYDNRRREGSGPGSGDACYGQYGRAPIGTTAPATDAAQQWDGWGTALKPAWEPVLVCRKPLTGTVAANVQQYGTGAINVDGCRAGNDSRPLRENPGGKAGMFKLGPGLAAGVTQQGRWPANLIHDGSDEVLAGFPQAGGGAYKGPTARRRNNGLGLGTDDERFGTSDAPDNYGDTGSAARFFYCAKASRADRDEGLEGMPKQFLATMNDGIGAREHNEGEPRAWVRNNHPTVKPTALMRYLCRLVTPPGGTVLDPFMGSGSTGKAAMLEGFAFIGIERETEYVEIARRRIDAVCVQAVLPMEVAA